MLLHFNRLQYVPGNIIQPNYGRVMWERGPSHPEWKREQILEGVRAAEFPNRPSRWECVFFFSTPEEARLYAQCGFAPRPAHLYDVELVEPMAPRHNADWKGTGPYDHEADWARRYWRGDLLRFDGSGTFYREELSLSPLRVLRELPAIE
ncbi:hypothetical protein [Acidimangrovimonas sediminis]|uniref:hypothetical protein n=1 Tax=Acidimangrovimonas sediminis TaxID=2056283 RepID=UPI000C80B815|nr:hypothetical protein [Acidimangrovimonas sediminis]